MPKEMVTSVTVAAAILDNRGKLAIVKDLGSPYWWLSGGDLSSNEDEETGVKRLISEQLSGTEIEIPLPAPILSYNLEKTGGVYRVFLCSPIGEVNPPSGELNMLQWIESLELNRYKILEIPRRALTELRQSRLFT